MGWKPADKIAVALFNFNAQNEHQLSLQVGDLLYILEEIPDWYRGYLYQHPAKRGVFPRSFVHLKDHTTTKKGSKTLVIPGEDEVGMEAKESLREWRAKLMEFYTAGPRDRYRQLLHCMEEVLSYRRTIVYSNATHDALQVTKMKLTAKIDLVNSRLNCPQAPRNEHGQVVDSSTTPIHSLYRLHQERQREIEQEVSQTGALQKKALGASKSQIHHLFFRVDYIDHQFPENCEVFFFLYDHGSKQSISERYLMTAGTAMEHSKFHEQERHSAVYTDLGARDLERSMFLVCQIVRKGKMLLDDRKSTSTHDYRRPYACGVLEVAELLRVEEDADTLQEEDCQHTRTMPLYVCSPNHDSDFATFHTSIIKKTGAKGGQKPGCAITMSLRAFQGDLAQLRRDFPLLFTKNSEVVHKLGFPDVILPGDVRNDIYVTLDHGQFEKGSKRAERNVEVAINVLDGIGKTIPGAIIMGAGAKPLSEYESFIYYHNNTPKWNELMKLSIPFERLPDAHLRIAFRHVAKNEPKDKADKTFAFAYLRIMYEDGSIIKDSSHELYVYKAEGKRWYDPKVYLTQASCKDDVISQHAQRTAGAKMLDTPGVQLSRSFRESIQLSTLTCSTKLTQKIELLHLLKWRQSKRDLAVVLRNVTSVGGEEVVKFLQDTLDCLFDILNSNSEKYDELVFNALVSIFSLMSDDRYHHFSTVLDIYISKHFSAILAYKFLIRSFDKNVKDCSVEDMHPKLIRIFKSMQYLFRFMVQSHTLYVRHNKRTDPSFRMEVQQAFHTFNDHMALQENKPKGIHLVQSALLLNLPAILPELVQIFSELEIAALLSNFLSAILNTHGSLPGDKLLFMLKVLNGPVKLLESNAARTRLIPTMEKLLTFCMHHQLPRTNYSPDEEANSNCLLCVGQLLETLAKPDVGVGHDDIELVTPLLHPLIQLCRHLPKINPLAQLNVVNFIGLLALMEDDHFATVFATMKSTYGNSLKEFLMDLMVVLGTTMTNAIYPKDWATLHFSQNKAILKALQNISRALIDGFLNNTDFTPQIWDHFFAQCTTYLTQPCLQLEQFSDFRKHQYQQQFGDMRLTMGRHVVFMWHKLSDKKGNFIPNLIGPFLEMTFLKQRELRRSALPVIFDIMKCEQVASGNFKRVETEVFDKIDDLVSRGQGDEEYKEMFHEILQKQCSSGKGMESTGTVFIDSVCRLIALLLDYRKISNDECHKNRRMGCMLNLLNFYKEIEKEELYIRYIYKLAELHERDQSFTEAGFTLLLHAKGLEWTNEIVHAVGRYPRQSARERKVQLYEDAIRLFDQGKTWESGIPLCKELADLYETELFDYQKLAAILQRQAEFFQKIIRELRVEPEYFMVGYYGRGFPLFIRNKVFVHRGQPYEKLGSFLKRLTDEYSTAQILKTTTPPDTDVQNSNGMYLQVRTVHPMAEVKELFRGKRVPDKVAEYYRTNDVRKFRYDRPFHKGVKNKECEFASLWIDRTTFTTTDNFPGVISWFEVSDTTTFELNPLDIALETVESKNREIQTMTAQLLVDKTMSINPLSMMLNGVIDAAVMGGISNYEKIFFIDSYVKEHPDHAEGVKKLRTLIEEQTTILDKALTLHGQRIDVSLQGLHEKLEACFEEFQGMVFPDRRRATVVRNKSKGRNSAASTLARPLPPTPFEGGSPPSNKRSSGLQTLPGRIVRRATGMPGKFRLSQASIEEPKSESPKRARRSSTMKSKPMPTPPSPHSKKRVSLTGSSENLSVKEGNLANSRQGSSGSINKMSEDDEGLDDYEPVQDFLGLDPGNRGTPQSTPSKTSRPAPVYAAPPPPSSNQVIDDHDYEPVTVGSLPAEPERYDDLERATLPYGPAQRAVMNVGNGRSPKRAYSENLEAKRSPPRGERERSPSTPAKYEQKQALPTVHENVPSQQQKGKLHMPPKPTSPPPSPPKDVFSPPGIKPKTLPQLHDRLSKSPDSEVAQPKLPPKQRKQASIRLQSSTLREPDDGIYAFDKLDQTEAVQSPVVPPKQRKVKPQSMEPMEVMEPDPGVYGFDTLEPLPQNSHPQNVQHKVKPQSMEPVGVMEPDPGVYGFDTLEPLPQNSYPQNVQRKAKPQPVEPVGVMEPDPGVYGFDTLEPLQQNSYPQNMQRNPKPQSMEPMEVMEPDPGVYGFDTLEPLQQNSHPQNVPQAQDDVYFDHLFSGPEENQLLTPGSAKSPMKKTPPPKPTAYSPTRETSPNEAGGNPPPVPVKRSRTFRQDSSSEAPSTPISTTPREESYLTEGKMGERPRPTPRPRTNTLDKKRSMNVDTPPIPSPRPPREDFLTSSGDYSLLEDIPAVSGDYSLLEDVHTVPPTLPPKPQTPSLPPKPSRPPLPKDLGGTKPPPLPQKPSGWRSFANKR